MFVWFGGSKTWEPTSWVGERRLSLQKQILATWVSVLNLVAVGQTVRAYVRRSAASHFNENLLFTMIGQSINQSIGDY